MSKHSTILTISLFILASCTNHRSPTAIQAIKELESFTFDLGHNYLPSFFGNISLFIADGRLLFSVHNSNSKIFSIYDFDKGNLIRNYHYTSEGPNAVFNPSAFALNDDGGITGLGYDGIFKLDSLSEKISILKKSDIEITTHLHSGEQLCFNSPYVNSWSIPVYSGAFLWFINLPKESIDTLHFLSIDTAYNVQRISFPVDNRMSDYRPYLSTFGNIVQPQIATYENILYVNYSYTDQLVIIKGDQLTIKNIDFNLNQMPPLNTSDIRQLANHMLKYDFLGQPIINSDRKELYFIISSPNENSESRQRKLMVVDMIHYQHIATYVWPENYTNDIFIIDSDIYTINKDVPSENIVEVVQIQL